LHEMSSDGSAQWYASGMDRAGGGTTAAIDICTVTEHTDISAAKLQALPLCAKLQENV
jgi:hypothetical protein